MYICTENNNTWNGQLSNLILPLHSYSLHTITCSIVYVCNNITSHSHEIIGWMYSQPQNHLKVCICTEKLNNYFKYECYPTLFACCRAFTYNNSINLFLCPGSWYVQLHTVFRSCRALCFSFLCRQCSHLQF